MDLKKLFGEFEYRTFLYFFFFIFFVTVKAKITRHRSLKKKVTVAVALAAAKINILQTSIKTNIRVINITPNTVPEKRKPSSLIIRRNRLIKNGEILTEVCIFYH